MQSGRSWLYRCGVALLAVGAGPLVLFIIAEKLGLVADPNPNPIGLGLLFFVTAPISAVLILVGRSRPRRD